MLAWHVRQGHPRGCEHLFRDEGVGRSLINQSVVVGGIKEGDVKGLLTQLLTGSLMARTSVGAAKFTNLERVRPETVQQQVKMKPENLLMVAKTFFTL